MDDKICRTCKYFLNSRCNNKQFKESVTVESNTSIHTIVEDGYLSSYLEEDERGKSIVKKVIKFLKDIECLKKSKTHPLNKRFSSGQDEDLYRDIEFECEDVIYRFMLDKISEINTDILICNPEVFSCVFWE